MRFKDLRKSVAIALAVVMVVNSLWIGLAQAKMIATDHVIQSSSLSAERDRIMRAFSREDVQQELVVLGIDPREAEARVASLTDEEVREVAGRLDQLPAGQSAIGAVVGAIVLIFLVLLITDLLGLTDVFPFVKKRAR